MSNIFVLFFISSTPSIISQPVLRYFRRKIIGDRLDVVSFSTDALANSYIEELSLLENVLETEITLLHGYFMFLHQNKELVSFIGVQP